MIQEHVLTWAKVATAVVVVVALCGCATGNPPILTREWSVSAQGKQPVKDSVRSGSWWWPTEPPQGVDENSLWGNRGVVYQEWAPKPAPKPPVAIAEVPKPAPVKTEPIRVEPPKPPAEPPKPPAPPEPKVRERIVFEACLFDLNKADLKPESLPKIQKAVNVLKQYPADTAVIEGHTCSRGAEAYNLKLGMSRAEAVKRHLVEMGIAPERIKTISYGESRPIADNSTEAGRVLNRRAVMDIVEGK